MAGALLAFAVLAGTVVKKQTRFSELAQGQATTTVLAERDGRLVHATSFDQMSEVLAGVTARGLGQQVLWLGNSQLHAINQHREGEQTAPGLLFDSLQRQQIELVTFSFPNANLQEHLVAFACARSRLSKLRALILPVVFDDLRETGIRADLQRCFVDATVRGELGRSDIGRRLLAEWADGAAEDGDRDLGGVKNTLQERSERALNDWLDAHWSLWRARREARGQLFSRLYLIRNSTFGIDAQSKRPLRRGSYEANMAALRALLAEARSANAAVLLYIVPLRDDVAPPYVPSEYRSFRATVGAMSAQGVRSVDFGSLVPAELWGMKGSTDLDGRLELDFMHFRGGGHELLARAVESELAAMMSEALR